MNRLNCNCQWHRLARLTVVASSLAMLVVAPVSTFADDHPTAGPEHPTAKMAEESAEAKPAPVTAAGPIRHSKAYPLDTCPVTGAKLGSMGDPVIHNHEGREVRFCCAGCLPKFNADPASYLKKIDEQIIAAQKDTYPLDLCPISGNKLGMMGEPVDVVIDNRLVRFCCSGCVGTFQKESDKHWPKLDKAVVEKQRDAYPLKTCVVSGDELGGAMGPPIEYVFGTQLMRFCCAGCVKDFEKNPQLYLKKLDEAKSSAVKTEEPADPRADDPSAQRAHDHSEHNH